MENSQTGALQRVVLAVDDTDDATKATSTGEIAGIIEEEVPKLGGEVVLGITRHQLLIAEGVPYTSHNSTMAVECRLPPGAAVELRERAIRIIAEHRAESSDPGLAVAVVPEEGDANSGAEPAAGAAFAAQRAALVRFGWSAKAEFCPVSSAYALASQIPWLRLSEHGGDGAGVVGALAGVGLRLDGNDGRFRGKWNLRRVCGYGPGVERAATGEVLERLASGLGDGAQVRGVHGERISDELPLELSRGAKPLLKEGKLTIVCEVEDGVACPCGKADLGEMGNVRGSWQKSCALFERDNDPEECAGPEASCRNCLYRRWVPEGFQCVLPQVQAATWATGQ